MSRYKGELRASARKDRRLLTDALAAGLILLFTFCDHPGGTRREMAMHHNKEINSEIWKEITLNYLGKRVRGNYKVVGRAVIVLSGDNNKTANLGILPAERLAHMLLREMAFEKRHKSPFGALTQLLNKR